MAAGERAQRIDNEATENDGQPRPRSRERRWLSGPPVENGLRTLNAEKWREHTGNNNHDTQHANCSWHARA